MTRAHGRRERAQVLALAAVVMVAMVGLLALAVDAGIFLLVHRDIQKAVDAGAEAGIVDLYIAATTTSTNILTPCAGSATPSTCARVSAEQTAETVTLNNLGITRRFCPNPSFITKRTEGTQANAPGAAVYDFALKDGSGSVVTVAVTVECNAGYTFGRILDLANMRVGASGSSAIGGLIGSDCPVPFVVPEGTLGPQDAQDGWGWPIGTYIMMNIGPQTTTGTFTFSGMNSPLTPLDGQTFIATLDDTVSLTPATIPKASAQDLANWINRTWCSPVDVGSNDSLGSNGGTFNDPVGPVMSAFATRFNSSCTNVFPNICKNSLVTCPDGLDPRAGANPVANSDWTVHRVSSCFASIPVLTQASYNALEAGNGNVSGLTVVGFNLFYVSYVAAGGNNNPDCNGTEKDCLVGYYLKPAINGQAGAFVSNGQPIFRPVR